MRLWNVPNESMYQDGMYQLNDGARVSLFRCRVPGVCCCSSPLYYSTNLKPTKQLFVSAARAVKALVGIEAWECSFKPGTVGRWGDRGCSAGWVLG